MRWGFGMKQGPFELWQQAGWATVAAWVQADIDAERRHDELTAGEPAQLIRLRRAKRVLEMENDILKRAATSIAREEVLPK